MFDNAKQKKSDPKVQNCKKLAVINATQKNLAQIVAIDSFRFQCSVYNVHAKLLSQISIFPQLQHLKSNRIASKSTCLKFNPEKKTHR